MWKYIPRWGELYNVRIKPFRLCNVDRGSQLFWPEATPDSTTVYIINIQLLKK